MSAPPIYAYALLTAPRTALYRALGNRHYEAILDELVSEELHGSVAADSSALPRRALARHIAPVQVCGGWDPRGRLFSLMAEHGAEPVLSVEQCEGPGGFMVYEDPPPIAVPAGVHDSTAERLYHLLRSTIEIARESGHALLYIGGRTDGSYGPTLQSIQQRLGEIGYEMVDRYPGQPPHPADAIPDVAAFERALAEHSHFQECQLIRIWCENLCRDTMVILDTIWQAPDVIYEDLGVARPVLLRFSGCRRVTVENGALGELLLAPEAGWGLNEIAALQVELTDESWARFQFQWEGERAVVIDCKGFSVEVLDATPTVLAWYPQGLLSAEDD